MHAFTYAYVLCIYGLHLRITLREKQLGGKKGEERRGGGSRGCKCVAEESR